MKATSENSPFLFQSSKAAALAGQRNNRASKLSGKPGGEKAGDETWLSLLNRTTRQLSLTEEGERYFVAYSQFCRRWQRQNQKLWSA